MRTGQRREGSYYALISFFQKLGTGATLWVMGQVFDIAGYINPPATDVYPAQPDSAIMVIRLFMSIVPAVLLVAAIAFARKYPITREKHRSLLEQLEQRD